MDKTKLTNEQSAIKEHIGFYVDTLAQASYMAGMGKAQAELEKANAKILELEKLCDTTYVAQGADAYNHACSEMERWQQKRFAAGKDAGCEGSLCDGMAWLYGHIDELEEKLYKMRKQLAKLKTERAR